MTERTRPTAPVSIRLVLPMALALLYLPLVMMVIASFLDQEQGALTLRWYAEVFSDRLLLEAVARSFFVALPAAAVATVLGLCGALALDRWAFGGKRVLKALSLLSLMLPELVLALSLLSWFALAGLELSLATVAIAHVTLTLPFVIMVIGARLRGMSADYEDAARDLGAREAQVLFQVTLPMLAPAIATAFILAFLLSFDNFLVTFYTNGAGSDTLPVRLYSLMKTGLSPKIQALSSLMLFASVTIVLLLARGKAVENVSR